MMLDTVLELVKQAGADAWEVTETKTEGWEFYFIRHLLDQNRIRKTTSVNVRLFRKSEDGTMIGSASEEIPGTLSREEAGERIREILERASYAQNPYYTLRGPAGDADGASQPAGSEDVPGAAETAAAYLETMRAVPESAETDLNSYEIFVNRKQTRFLNSEGVDVAWNGTGTMLEAVVNARNAEHEVELYRISAAGGCDREQILRELSGAMHIGRDRLRAVPMPKLGSIPVVFSTREGTEICRFFTGRLSAAFKARGYSDLEIGVPAFGGNMETKLTVEALRSLPMSSGNAPYDPEGAPVRDTVMMKDGVPLCFLGDRQFSCYLGLEDSFIPGNYRISGGTASEDELRAGDYLEAVEFSNFQVDELSGNIAGEIRLAYWHHGGEVTPVTGGSVSAALLAVLPSMKMSRDLVRYDNMEIPSLIRLENVSVTGIETLSEP